METRVKWRMAILALAVFAAISQSARADNLFWIGGNSDQYSDGLNWSFFEGLNVTPSGVVPAPGNFAVFEKSAAVSFSNGQPPSVANLQIFNGGVTFTLGPISFQDAIARTYTTSQLYVVAPFEDGNFLNNYNIPNGANGSLLLSGGTMIVNGQTVVGSGNSKNVGTLTLQASELETNGDLTVAQVGHGYLNIGTASLVTSNGGNVGIGNQSGSTGAATVSGGSAWLLGASSPLTVGVQGTGSLLVEGSSTVAGNTLNIGTSGVGSATVTVDGGGSQLNFTHLNVGFGNGSLTIQNGASAASGTSDGSSQTSIGVFENCTGAATVTGAGSSWTTNNIAVGGGNTGHGSLTISSGGAVASINATIGGGQGSVQLSGSGSSWTISGGLTVSQFGNSNASLNIGAGSTVSVGTSVQIYQGGSVQIDGTLNAASVSFSGGSIVQTGTVNLSDSSSHIGTLSINNGGSYTGAPVLGVASVGHTDAAGFAYVQGSGSTWAIPGSYQLGAGAGPVTVNVDSSGTVSSGDLGIGQITAGQLQIDGSGSSWTSTGTITIGTAATGSINLSNGGALSATALVVNSQGSISATFNNSVQAANVTINNGTLKVGNGTLTTGSTTIPSGSLQLMNSNWTDSGSLYVGGDGSAAASGPPAAAYIVGGSASVGGVVKVWGPGQVGIDGNANVGVQDVDIEGGSFDILSGQVNSNGGSLMVAGHGEYSQSMGDFNSNGFPSVTVNGALFNIPNGAITLHATQSLVATNGSFVIAGSGGVQVKAGATLSLTDSTLTAGSLDVYGGLTLSNATINVNDFNLDGGTITALATLPVNSEIKGFGTIAGNVQLAGGALNARGGALAVTGDISGYGVLVGAVSSATLTPTGNFTLSGNKNELGSQTAVLVSSGPAHLDGVLTSDGGTVTSASGIAIDAAGVISGSITIHGDVTNGGLLDVGGDQIGLDTIDGNLTLHPSGVIRVQVGGADPSDYDRIMVKNGNVTLGGTLDLEFVNGFLPKQGDQFNIFIDDFSGSFSNVEVSGLGDWNYTVAGGPTGVTLNSMSDAVAVPEPGALALLIISIPGALLLCRRARRIA